MYRVNYAYKHENGEIEGFSGFAFGGKDAAKKNCIAAMAAKCSAIQQPFRADRVKKSSIGMSAAEMKIVREDWASYDGAVK